MAACRFCISNEALQLLIHFLGNTLLKHANNDAERPRLEELQRCMVDTLEEWEDYAPFAANPFGSRPVWIGYDPSHRGDSAGCVVLAPPVVAGGKFRILERHQWKGMDFATQAESIRKLTEKYNVEYIGIDATGLGVGVFQLVRSFYPAARDIRYPACSQN